MVSPALVTVRVTKEGVTVTQIGATVVWGVLTPNRLVASPEKGLVIMVLLKVEAKLVLLKMIS